MHHCGLRDAQLLRGALNSVVKAAQCISGIELPHTSMPREKARVISLDIIYPDTSLVLLPTGKQLSTINSSRLQAGKQLLCQSFGLQLPPLYPPRGP